ncbi:MAG: type II toxin-antitoxin system VapC family toxin [Chloroflexota bacterium]|nr:type II toxin-antitoxin system VapC family toxin [Chloroflexota bacterium]
MIFVDTNVFMYAVGRAHPLKSAAREFLTEASRAAMPLCTSAEVVQELAHAYLRVSRPDAFDEALATITGFAVEVWPLGFEDVTLARQLSDRYPQLSARDLCHLASCRRRGVSEIKTFDRGLDAVAGVRG